jgi:hypothetical protein
MLIQRVRNHFVILAAGLSAVACGRVSGPVTVDPEVTFAAHVVRDGMVMDRVPGGGTASLERPGNWLGQPGIPTYVLKQDDDILAALWHVGGSRVVVRTEASTLAEGAGEVLDDWDGGAIRLTLYLPNRSTLRSDTFAREADERGPSRLSRSAQTDTDVRGNYRAALRDAKGKVVGWLRVRVGPYQAAERMYDGVTPDDIGPGLAAATALALDTEVTWIQDHAAEAGRGSGTNAPREDSTGR